MYRITKQKRRNVCRRNAKSDILSLSVNQTPAQSNIRGGTIVGDFACKKIPAEKKIYFFLNDSTFNHKLGIRKMFKKK